MLIPQTVWKRGAFEWTGKYLIVFANIIDNMIVLIDKNGPFCWICVVWLVQCNLSIFSCMKKMLCWEHKCLGQGLCGGGGLGLESLSGPAAPALGASTQARGAEAHFSQILCLFSGGFTFWREPAFLGNVVSPIAGQIQACRSLVLWQNVVCMCAVENHACLIRG